jgi:hypothetical protein
MTTISTRTAHALQELGFAATQRSAKANAYKGINVSGSRWTEGNGVLLQEELNAICEHAFKEIGPFPVSSPP